MKLNIQPTIFKRTALAFALLSFFSTTGLSQTSVTDLYRLNDGRGHHFYTTDQNERKLLIQKGWSDEGVTTKCFSTSTPGTVKVERLFNPATGDHLYTTNQAEVTKAVTSLGFRIENLKCWIYPNQVPGSAPVYRLHFGNDHFYTSSDSERQNAVQNLKYTQESTLGYGVAPPGDRRPTVVPQETQRVVQHVLDQFAEAAKSDADSSADALKLAADKIQEAFDNLDKSDPFGPTAGAGADFPAVCIDNWRAQMGEFIQEEMALEKSLKESGDPNPHQTAVNAFRDRMKLAGDTLLRCLNQPPQLKPAADPG